MPTKRRIAAKKVARRRKLRVAGEKAAKTRKLKAAADTKAANTRKRRAAAWKAAATKKPRAVAAEVRVVPAEVPPAAAEVRLLRPASKTGHASGGLVPLFR